MSEIPADLLEALALIGRRPKLPVPYMAMAHLLNRDPVALELQLLCAARAGLVDEHPVEACGHFPSMFELTDAGHALLQGGDARIVGQVHGVR